MLKTTMLCFLLLITTATSRGDEFISGVKARATSEQVAGLFAASNVCNDKGLSDSGKGDGSRKLTVNGYAENGNCWQSGYLPRGADESPIIEFDLGATETVGRFHVWNHNGSPSRGFKQVSVLISEDGKKWRQIAQQFEFAKAPRSEDYIGESYSFEPSINARFIRFHADSTHRSGGQPDLAGLGKVRFFRATATSPAPSASPSDRKRAVNFVPGYVDLSAAPYFAKGDGKTDDTEALQRAIHDWQGRHRVLFLPAGTYRVTKSLRLKPGVGHGYTTIRGAGRELTILKLDDNTFTDPQQPQPVLSFGFNGREDGKGVHADWFNNNAADFTIDIGKGNAGAIGLQFYSNNVGSLRDVTIRSGDGQGAIGLDLAYADQNGPLLVTQTSIDGFALGVRTGATVNSQTLEHVTVTNATRLGFENHGQCLALRGLKLSGPSPSFVSHYGVVALIDSAIVSTSEKPLAVAAMKTGETLFARNITTTGFSMAIENSRKRGEPTPSLVGPNVDEWVSSAPLTLFGGENEGTPKSLSLPISETPTVPEDPVANWANVRAFRELADPDDSASIQRAIDSGASTIYFAPCSHSYLSQSVIVRGNVRRITGCFAGLHTIKPRSADAEAASKTESSPRLIVGKDIDRTIFIDDIIGDVFIEHSSPAALVVRNGQGTSGIVRGNGRLFIENVVADWNFENGHIWARQFNNEKLGTHISNHGASLWILGLKTERGGTLIETQSGGQTELIGGLSYTTNNGKLAPMFVSSDARVSLTIGEVCYTGDPFSQLVREHRKGQSRQLNRKEAPLRASFLQGSEIPLFVGK